MAQTDQLLPDPAPQVPPPRRRPARPAMIAVLVLAVGVAALAVARSSSTPLASRNSLVRNPYIDPGTAVNRPAPKFTLTDQFGRPVSLGSYRGKVVILAFNDSECTTICPLTTTAMVDARRSLGPAASKVQLLGIDANPDAISTADVLRYTQLHGLLGKWRFLTGSLRRLRAVWKAYGIGVEIERGQIDHTPALFVIGPQGRLRRVFLTQASYAAIPQLGQLLAQEASRLLPGHPRVRTHYSYRELAGIAPGQPHALPRVGGGRISLGPGSPRLYLFFASWDREIGALGRQLEALGRYGGPGLPSLAAIDEGSVEPSPSALPGLLRQLPRPLPYPVGIDASGRVADGYGVHDEPWLVLVSAAGRIVWYRDVGVSGWPGPRALENQVRAALTAAPRTSTSGKRSLAGSPAPLAALHRQAGQLLGSSSAFLARVRSLRGYPIVVNVWASWCVPCQEEFGLLRNAADRYGRQVAFLGADVNDSSADAAAFLHRHPVSYPSYGMPLGAVHSLLPQGVIGLPTTFFIGPGGRVVSVHTGQYDSQGTLDQDIQSYALGH